MPQERESKGSSAGLVIVLTILLLAGGGVALWRFAPSFPPNLLHRTNAAAAPAPPEVILSLHGSNTIGAQLAGTLAEAFLKREGAPAVMTKPGARADEYSLVATLPGDTLPKAIEIQAHGSATAFTDMAAGKCEIGMASRPIKPEEAATLTKLGDMTSAECEHVVGLDGLAIIVNKSNPVSALTKDQVAKIFSGEIANWKDAGGGAGPIEVLARDDKSGTYDTFKALVLGKAKLVAGAVRIEDSRELSDRVADNANAIGFIGLPYIRSAKAVAVSEPGVAPLLPNRLTVGTEDYLLSRRLFFYVAAQPKPLVRRFVEFALGSDGQDVVARNGFVELNVKAGSAAAATNSTPEYMKLITGAQRLSLNFRFRPGSTDLDNRALVDLDRVSGFLADPAHQHGGIILCGFADAQGKGDVNQALALSRANAVAEEFKRRGIAPTAVSAFGASNPVASNKAEDGRQKNRRVEVWMRTM